MCWDSHYFRFERVFLTVILTRNWWRSTLIYNTKHRKPLESLETKFQEIRIKTVAVTMFFFINIAAMTSSIMLISKTKNDLYRNFKVLISENVHLKTWICFYRWKIFKKLLFWILLKFDCYFNGHFWSNLLKMHIFSFNRSRSVRNGILFLDSRHFRF